uniref:26S proteasome non-ATPase regulatory subunit 1 n=1 Tax=Macrostomum lignano TaxID=282301 RepID=A0A1I8HYZ4_9PLAT
FIPQSFALSKLNTLVDVFWPEISDSVSKIEMLHEDRNFPQSKLAALVASKVYYHLGAYDESLFFALHADELFDIDDSAEYVETIVCKCIDRYIKNRVAQIDEEVTELDERDEQIRAKLEGVINRMFERCFEHRQFKHAVGIAIDMRRLDILERCVQLTSNKDELLNYSYRLTVQVVQNRKFRQQLLQTLVRLYRQLQQPDFVSMSQCLILLDDPPHTAEILERLVSRSEDEALTAFQIAFDLYENASQQFMQRVHTALAASPLARRPAGDDAAAAPAAAAPSASEADADADVDTAAAAPDAASTAPKTPPPQAEEMMTTDSSEVDEAAKERFARLLTILSGEKVIQLHLQFLIRNNRADARYLDRLRESVRNSITHSATVTANGFMHAGTTSDQFLRDNLEWLGRATNWAKFAATASLGCIHRGHETESLRLMAAYLPRNSAGTTAYSEGGGLYALGLIHANHGSAVTDYLLQQLSGATAEPVRHGACLGLGLAAMGTARQDVYEAIKLSLYQDDAIVGEAAGLAMGLVMLGSSSSAAVKDMVSYAKETQHDKIIRGLAVGVALTMYGRLEEADLLAQSLLEDKDPILRWSGVYTVAMAYCGSGSNSAVRRLLHYAVTDTSDDVRRAAVLSIGFVLFKSPEQVPDLVSLLAESFNPHVRYGAAMALGIACAGTALKEAINILDPMTQDAVHFVRQGALIALGMVLIQQNGVNCPKAGEFRELCLKVVADKHEDVMAKHGAILGLGIVDAGGRNVTISLQTRTGQSNMAAAVGVLVFQQFWYWYPLTHFLCLAFTPTSLIGLNKALEMPQVQFRSNAKPSTFDYPPPLVTQVEKKKEKVETAVLSITAKQKRKEQEKKKTAAATAHQNQPGGSTTAAAATATSASGPAAAPVPSIPEGKETPAGSETSSATTAAAAPAAAASTETSTKEPAPASKSQGTLTDKPATVSTGTSTDKPGPEPNFSLLSNPCRVMRAQQRLVTLEGGRYQPVKSVTIGGIIMLRDRRPDEKESLVPTVKAHGPTSANSKEDDLPEPPPPEPFQWSDDML